MATIVTALVVLGILFLVILLLMFVHKRDQKKDAVKNKEQAL